MSCEGTTRNVGKSLIIIDMSYLRATLKIIGFDALLSPHPFIAIT